MRVLHVNSNYLYTTLHEKMICSLTKKGIKNKVFMPNNGIAKYLIDPKDYVYSPVCFSSIDRYIYHLKQSKIFNSLKKEIEVKSYDVIHAHTLFTDGNVAYKINREYEIPYIVTVRNTDVNIFFRYLLYLRRTGLRILENASKIIFISPAYKELVFDLYIPENLQNKLNEKSEILPNGIDEFWHEHRVKKKTNINKTIRIITAALICRNKNQENVCKAIEILVKKGLNIEYFVIGKIQNMKIYNKIIRYPFVKYTKYLTKEELKEQYRLSDIFVMPSYTETFGLVYAEAMSQGLPVIYSKGQGFDKQFDEGIIGYHVDSKSPKDIANAIEKVILDYDRMSENCTNLSLKFSWETISDEYRKIYEYTKRD